ncbi:pyridoxamine 5'-phosphate oxidase [Duganella sp. FT80W]|uniref:Pyridoxamine 5'-phosphate oxidase n=1 Tax=Duganella guangzhouensis TaxID=2666084 RepID=A0A6I2KX80_9BURK|nr:MSMEG_1061 family FMN-dependent PPOX-type flavoprotein [Duganella guangzhouensis]MRW88589.1 pyridoxamine 5'-phosphate oxidase [Duganella guangzhouensis]
MTSPDLDSLYQPPSEFIQKAVLPQLMPFHVAYVEQATFFCLATGRAQGLDASPRGGRPGFVRVLDQHTIAFADWPGNNRIESLRNLQDDPRVALLFIFPGLEVFLRINGTADISTDAALLASMTEAGKIPKTAVTIHIQEVLFHCGKAINRARLWSEDSRIARDAVPSVGQIAAAITGMAEAQAAAMTDEYHSKVKTELY